METLSVLYFICDDFLLDEDQENFKLWTISLWETTVCLLDRLASFYNHSNSNENSINRNPKNSTSNQNHKNDSFTKQHKISIPFPSRKQRGRTSIQNERHSNPKPKRFTDPNTSKRLNISNLFPKEKYCHDPIYTTLLRLVHTLESVSFCWHHWASTKGGKRRDIQKKIAAKG